MEYENIIEFTRTTDKFEVKLLPIDFSVIAEFSKIDNRTDFSLSRFHLVIFKEEDTLYVKETNIDQFIRGEISLKSIIRFIEDNSKFEMTINKMVFTFNGIDFYYDDDSLLIIKLSVENFDSFLEVKRVIMTWFETVYKD